MRELLGYFGTGISDLRRVESKSEELGKLLEMFNSLLRSDSQMQLICTTHESNLLSAAPIRQDEVWFVEKDKKGESHLSSLCEYKPRENVQKGYLNGDTGLFPSLVN